MRTGALDGTIANTWKVIYDSGELAAAATSINITGLNGDVDGEYRLISRVVNGYNGACGVYFDLNGDSTNCGFQYLVGVNTTVSAARGSIGAMSTIAAADALGKISFSDSLINVKTGSARTCLTKYASEIAGTTVGEILLWGGVYNNSVTNITSISIFGGGANALGIGSRFILMKKVPALGMRTGELNVQGIVKGTWQEIYKTTLAESATSVTVSGLTGDTDVLYRIRVRIVGGYNGNYATGITLNGYTGNKYGFQYIDGSVSSPTAGRAVGANFPQGNPVALNGICFYETLLYAKSGFIRTMVTEGRYGNLGVQLIGGSYNDTATEITSIGIVSAQANGLGVGTSISVERLNL